MPSPRIHSNEDRKVAPQLYAADCCPERRRSCPWNRPAVVGSGQARPLVAIHHDLRDALAGDHQVQGELELDAATGADQVGVQAQALGGLRRGASGLVWSQPMARTSPSRGTREERMGASQGVSLECGESTVSPDASRSLLLSQPRGVPHEGLRGITHDYAAAFRRRRGHEPGACPSIPRYRPRAK